MATNQVTVQQAAEILGCTEGTVRQWIKAGKLKSYYDEVTRSYRLDRWNVTALARQRQQQEENKR